MLTANHSRSPAATRQDRIAAAPAFGAERAAGEPGRAGQRRVDDAAELVRLAGNGRTESRLDEIPREVDADRHPQRASGDVRGPQQDSALQDDRERTPEHRAPIGIRTTRQVHDAEEHRGHRQGNPGAEARLDDAEHDAPEHDLFGDRGADHDPGGRQQFPGVPGGQLPTAGNEDDQHRGQERTGSDDHAPQEPGPGAIARELADRLPPLEEPAQPPVAEQRRHAAWATPTTRSSGPKSLSATVAFCASAITTSIATSSNGKRHLCAHMRRLTASCRFG